MNIKPIQKQIHKNTRIKANPNFEQSKSSHMVPISVLEFVSVAQEYPIVFVKNPETGRFYAAAVLGLKPNENLFYSESGWKGDYIPESLKVYPFVAGSGSDDSERVIIGIDELCPLVNEEEGEALFDSDGNETEFAHRLGQQAADQLEKYRLTDLFVQKLTEYGLLRAQTLVVNVPGEGAYDLTGFYVIAENALNEMTDENFCELRKAGHIGMIYAALLSLGNVNHLARIRLSK